MAFNPLFHKGASSAQMKNALNPFQYIAQIDHPLPSLVIDIEEKVESPVSEEGPKGVETQLQVPLRLTGLYCDN